MSIGTLPQTLKVGGRDWRIRTDFRDILKIFEAMNDRELEHEEKIYTMLYILYPDLEKMPVRLYQEAVEQANWFIDAGTQDDEGESVRKMDWTQDEPIIFPAVNAVAGRETRAEKYMHWWTFLGYLWKSGKAFLQQLSVSERKRWREKLLINGKRSFTGRIKKSVT